MKSCQMYVIKIAHTCFILAQSFFRAYIFILSPLTFALLALSLLFNPDMTTQILLSLSLYGMSNPSHFHCWWPNICSLRRTYQNSFVLEFEMIWIWAHWVATLVQWLDLSLKNVLGLIPSQTHSVQSLPVLHFWVPFGYSSFHAQWKDVQVKLIAYFKLSTAMIVGVYGYLSLHDSPVIKWQLVQGVSRLHSVGTGIGYRPTLLMLSRVRWMNAHCHKMMKLFIKSLLRAFKLLVLSSQQPASKTCRNQWLFLENL